MTTKIPTKRIEIDVGVVIDELVDHDPTTYPLIYAAATNDEKLLMKLLETEPINQRNAAGLSALFVAACFDNEECVRVLLAAGADPDIQDNEGRTPLYVAAANKSTEPFLLLIDAGANPAIASNEKRTPLHITCILGDYTAADAILESAAGVDGNLLQLADGSGMLPQHLAARHGHDELIDLLNVHNAELDAPDANGRTMMHWAAEQGYDAVLEILLDQDTNPNLFDKDGHTPLHLAALCGHPDSVDLLINNKAELDLQDVNGLTPLHLAALNSH